MEAVVDAVMSKAASWSVGAMSLVRRREVVKVAVSRVKQYNFGIPACCFVDDPQFA